MSVKVDDPTPGTTAPSTPAEPSTPAPPAAAPAAPVVDITQTDEFKAALTAKVEEVYAGKKEQMRRQVQRELNTDTSAPTPDPETPPEPETPKPDKPNGQSRKLSKVGELELRLDFRDAVGEYAFSRPQRKLLEDQFVASGSNDSDGYLSDYCSTMGVGTKPPGTETVTPTVTPTPQTPPAVATPADPSGPPASDRGGPSTATDELAVANMENWGPDHITRLEAEALEAKQHPGRYVREKMLASLKGKTIVFPRK